MINLFAQVSSENLMAGGFAAAGVYLLKTGFDLYKDYRENQDRKEDRKQMTFQTEILRNTHSEIVKSRELATEAQLKMAVGMERQERTSQKIEHIDTGVTQLKIYNGIIDKELP